MASPAYWYETRMPEELVDIICRDLQNFDNFGTATTLGGGANLSIRDSKTNWIPAAHWIVGLSWHYVKLANEQNFLYDIQGFEQAGDLQYTSYEPGEYYNWHVDGDISNMLQPSNNLEEQFVRTNAEKSRKLSFILQLSDHTDYTGGEVQLQYTEGKTQFMPKTRGTVIVFDSRMLHRVKAVKTGHRKSLVGWVWGPRWK